MSSRDNSLKSPTPAQTFICSEQRVHHTFLGVRLLADTYICNTKLNYLQNLTFYTVLNY